MRYLNHDSGEAATLKNSQVLGDESPLEFDEDGRAGPVEDAVAEKLSAMHKYVDLGRRVHGDETAEDDEDFDAEAFVDRTPMDDVIEDLESGEYDDHLEAIGEVAEREDVQDVVDERKE